MRDNSQLGRRANPKPATAAPAIAYTSSMLNWGWMRTSRECPPASRMCHGDSTPARD